MDHDSLLLWIEIGALAIAVGLGIWRFAVLRHRPGTDQRPERSRAQHYDMRPDGQRVIVD